MFALLVNPNRFLRHIIDAALITMMMLGATVTAVGGTEENQYDVVMLDGWNRVVESNRQNGVTITNQPDSTTFKIVSGGIGSAIVTLKSGMWPKHVVLRFEYPPEIDSGRGFSNLELFSLTTGGKELRGSLKAPIDSAKARTDLNLTDGSGGSKEIAVEKRGKGLEIVLPSDFLVSTKRFTINWIDAYRN